MTFFPRSAVLLAIAAFAAGAHAEGNAAPPSDPSTIGGTYEMTTAQNCISTAAPGPGQSAFQVVLAPNGMPQVNVTVPPPPPGSPPALKLISTVAHLTMVINPRTGTLSSSNVRVTRLDENRGSGTTQVLQRTLRTIQGTFTVDRANDTLLVGTEIEQGVMPDNQTTFVLTHSPGRRLRTNDFGQTIFGVGSDDPVIIEQVITPPSGPASYNSNACDRTVTGHRISLKY